MIIILLIMTHGKIDFKLGGYIQEEKPFRDIGIKLPFHEFYAYYGFRYRFCYK